MNCDDIKLMISEYIDNELTKEKEAFLFTHLSSCLDCREEFKVQNQIQNEVKKNQKEVSERFERRVFDSIQKKEQHLIKRWITKPTPAYINYALGIVVILITLFSFLQVSSLRKDLNNYQEMYSSSIKQTGEQAEMIKILLKSLPPIRITPRDSGNIIRINL